MIKFFNQVPSVYPNASRDFQYLGWLTDIVLNSVKHNVDDIYNLPNNGADPKLTELLALTLGFKIKRNYDQDQLLALVAALPRILKYKGTKIAIDMAGNALIAASGASGDFYSETYEDSDEVPKGEIRVTFPVGLVDISLFTDLLDYILPAGMTCHIVRKNQETRPYSTEVIYDDTLIANWIPDLDWQKDGQTFPGLANMFDVYNNTHSFANFIDPNNANMANPGLLDNSIIPMLSRQSRHMESAYQWGSSTNESSNNEELSDVVAENDQSIDDNTQYSEEKINHE